MNLDKLYMVDRDEVAKAAFRVTNTLQTLDPAVQLAGVAVMFNLLCDHYSIRPATAMEMADRVRLDQDNREIEQIRALRHFMDSELPR